MKVLITGSTGFIGSHLVEALLGRGDDVTCLLRRTSDPRFLENLNVRQIEGDYSRPETLENAVTGMDAVFHLAGVISGENWESYRRGNVEATRHLIEACVHATPRPASFILVSSISAAGPGPEGVFRKETDPGQPQSFYGRSKKMAEEAVLSVASEIPVVVIRPPNVLGPRQKELLQAIRMIKKRIVPVLGNGRLQTSVVYVEDLVRILMAVADLRRTPRSLYYVCHPRACAWRDITAEIRGELGIRSPVLKVPYQIQIAFAALAEGLARLTSTRPRISREHIRAARSQYWLFDGSAIEHDLGLRADTDMQTAIRRTVSWYRTTHQI